MGQNGSNFVLLYLELDKAFEKASLNKSFAHL